MRTTVPVLTPVLAHRRSSAPQAVGATTERGHGIVAPLSAEERSTMLGGAARGRFAGPSPPGPST